MRQDRNTRHQRFNLYVCIVMRFLYIIIFKILNKNKNHIMNNFTLIINVLFDEYFCCNSKFLRIHTMEFI